MVLEFPDGPDNAPDGYVKIVYDSHPEIYNGPYFERRRGDLIEVGFRVKERHLNHARFLHGGVVAAFCDLQVRPIKLLHGLREFSPTVSMSVDYVESAQLGDWVWAEPSLVKRTKKLLFTQALVMVEDRVIARTSAIYRLHTHNTGALEPGVE